MKCAVVLVCLLGLTVSVFASPVLQKARTDVEAEGLQSVLPAAVGEHAPFLRLTGSAPERLVVRVAGLQNATAQVTGEQLLLQILADANRPCLAADTWADTASCVLRYWQAQLGQPATAMADVILVAGPGTVHEERHMQVSGLAVDAQLLAALVDATLADSTRLAAPYMGDQLAQYTHVQVEVQLHSWAHTLLHTLGLPGPDPSPWPLPPARTPALPPIASSRNSSTVKVSTTMVAMAWQGPPSSSSQRVVGWAWVVSVLYLLACGLNSVWPRKNQQPPHPAKRAAPRFTVC